MQQKPYFRLTPEQTEALKNKLCIEGLYDNQIISLLERMEVPCNTLMLSLLSRNVLQKLKSIQPYRAKGPFAYSFVYSALELVQQCKRPYEEGELTPSPQQLALQKMHESVSEMEKVWDKKRGRPREAGNHIFALHILHHLKAFKLTADSARGGLFPTFIFWLKHAMAQWAAMEHPELLHDLGTGRECVKIGGPAADAARKIAKEALDDHRGYEIMTPAFEGLDSIYASIEGSDLGQNMDILLRNHPKT